MNDITSGDLLTHQDTIVLRVRYAAAKQPFTDPHTAVTETLQSIKARALEHFKLTEGSADGGNKTYLLSYEEMIQSDLTVTAGSLVTHGKQLELLLVEQFTQG